MTGGTFGFLDLRNPNTENAVADAIVRFREAEGFVPLRDRYPWRATVGSVRLDAADAELVRQVLLSLTDRRAIVVRDLVPRAREIAARIGAAS